MSLQKLPPEIINHIASFISHDDLAELAETCQKCYLAVLPYLWHDITIHSMEDLETIARRLYSNILWRQRAIQFVHNITLCGIRHSRRCSTSFMARMFGIAITEENEADYANNKEQPFQTASIVDFGHLVLTLFPHVNHITFDFSQAFKCFRFSTPEGRSTLSFSGTISVRNYIADNTTFLYILLSHFTNMHELTVKSAPILSLCENLDELLLTNQDIACIASLELNSLTNLRLSYIDWTDTQIDTWNRLINTLPNLTSLDLSWLFSPNLESYSTVCDMLKESISLVPISSKEMETCKRVCFARKL
ncbi:hypothetical protein EDC96DRAFT_494862 [Choanephora cucurbitarum]|nr:hypothetical protein EDC96DRAFT_494862 [Choanephora cucurbitarum]